MDSGEFCKVQEKTWNETVAIYYNHLQHGGGAIIPLSGIGLFT